MQARAKTIDKNRINVLLYKGFIPYREGHCIAQTEEPKVGLDDKKIVTHCGRRSCITELARRGTDLTRCATKNHRIRVPEDTLSLLISENLVNQD